MMTRNKSKNHSIYIALSVILLFTLLTLADAGPPEPTIPVGLCSLMQEENAIYVNEMDGVFCSEDGGLNWQACNYDSHINKAFEEVNCPKLIRIPDSHTQYRITDLGRIHISEDDGKSWEKLSSAISTSEAISLSIAQTHPNVYNQRLGARDILYDQKSGNVIITIQSQGAVVIKPDGSLIKVAIGESKPLTLADPGIFTSMLIPYFLLSIVLVCIYFETLAVISQRFTYWIQLIIAALLWGFLAVDFKELLNGYYVVVGFPVIFFVSILLIMVGIHTEQQIRVYKKINKKVVVKLWVNSIPGGLAYFLCYILWYINIIPYLEWATYSSLSIALVWFIYCVVQSYKWKNPQKDSA
jgi:hypothetical protein